MTRFLFKNCNQVEITAVKNTHLIYKWYTECSHLICGIKINTRIIYSNYIA